MKKKILLSVVILLLPLFTYANGQEVLPLLFGEATLIIVFVISLFFVKLNVKGKLLLILIFITSLLITFLLTKDLPYNANKYLVEVIMLGIPIVLVLLGYLFLKKNKL